jgi:putative membrane protein
MRTLVKHGVFAVCLSIMALACGNDRPANTPQQPIEDPKPGAPNDPIANNHNAPQAPVNDPKAQTSAIDSHGAQQPINDPKPQDSTFGSGGSTAPGAKDKPMSDAEVLGVTAAANDGEVKMADLALKKAASAEVKKFATMMKTHHTAAAGKGKTIATKAKITPAENDVASSMKSDSASTMKDLEGKTGKDFDKAYMDAQVKAHKDVLDKIDNKLMPSAQNGEVKSMLTEMRQTVSTHLTKAEELSKKAQ